MGSVVELNEAPPALAQVWGRVHPRGPWHSMSPYWADTSKWHTACNSSRHRYEIAQLVDIRLLPRVGEDICTKPACQRDFHALQRMGHR